MMRARIHSQQPPSQPSTVDRPASAASKPPALEVSDSSAESAPFTFFDAVPTVGVHHGTIRIELAAGSVVPTRDGRAKTVHVMTAHLRCSPSAAANLRKAIDRAWTATMDYALFVRLISGSSTTVMDVLRALDSPPTTWSRCASKRQESASMKFGPHDGQWRRGASAELMGSTGDCVEVGDTCGLRARTSAGCWRCQVLR
jgi:hypothetical protein